MSFVIVKKRGQRVGKTRSEHYENLAKEGMPAGLTEEQYHKAKFLEKKFGKTWYRIQDIDNADKFKK